MPSSMMCPGLLRAALSNCSVTRVPLAGDALIVLLVPQLSNNVIVRDAPVVSVMPDRRQKAAPQQAADRMSLTGARLSGLTATYCAFGIVPESAAML